MGIDAHLASASTPHPRLWPTVALGRVSESAWAMLPSLRLIDIEAGDSQFNGSDEGAEMVFGDRNPQTVAAGWQRG